MVEWVVDAAQESAAYLSIPRGKQPMAVSVSVLTPHGDPVAEACQSYVNVLEGHEHDVLSRYHALLQMTGADYIVRVTGDCPLIPPPVITKAVNVAVMNGFDYVSNVDPRLRLSFDGMDCEVVSARLLRHMDEHAVEPGEREHVTTYARSDKLPTGYRTAHIIGYLDLSSMKLSVDTEEDLEAVRKQKAAILAALENSEAISGTRATFRF